MHSYEDLYKSKISKTYEFSPNESLIDLFDFFKTSFGSNIDIKSSLEIGCGLGLHINSENSCWDVEGLDISQAACELLTAKSGCRIYTEDFLKFRSEKKWDLILDSHLLHCLIGVDSFQKYFANIERSLRSGGHLLLEVMCKSREMEFDLPQRYDLSEEVLYQDGQPIRTILSSRALEDIIIKSGLKIVYLRVDEIIKFIPNAHRSECMLTDPDRMRVICLKE